MLTRIMMDKDRVDKTISVALMSSFVILSFQYLILISFNLINSSVGDIVQTTSKFLVALIYFYALPFIVRINPKAFFYTYTLAILIFALNFLFFQDNRIYLNELFFSIFFTIIPSFLYSICLRDLSIFQKVIKRASYIIFIISSLISILIFTGKATLESYSMALSNYLLLPAIILIWSFFKKPKVFYLISFIWVLTVIIALGSRGAIVSLVFFVITLFVFSSFKLSYKSVLIKAVAISISILVLLNSKTLILNIENVFLKYGINSRTIWLLKQDEIHLSGREWFYNNLLSQVASNPLLPNGLAGDRVLLNGGYSHNIYLEIIINFGLITGSILFIVMILIFIIAFTSKSILYRELVLIWISLGFIHLLFSGSYLTDIKFWILTGITINIVFLQKKLKLEEY